VRAVLILVVVEIGLGEGVGDHFGLDEDVLILVVVEIGLGEVVFYGIVSQNITSAKNLKSPKNDRKTRPF
jgi:hypothetical protein